MTNCRGKETAGGTNEEVGSVTTWGGGDHEQLTLGKGKQGESLREVEYL